MESEQIKELRTRLHMSQQAFASALGVSFATVNRWENGKAKPQSDRIQRMKALMLQSELPIASEAPSLPFPPIRLDFEGDADAVKLVVDAHRIQNGHIFNNAFGLELSRVVPLPHQRIAVYEQMLSTESAPVSSSRRCRSRQNHHDRALHPRDDQSRKAKESASSARLPD